MLDNRELATLIRLGIALLWALSYKNIRSSLTRGGLPQETGITMSVAKDGQAWYAWRRTITGWCFAIGAAGSPLINGNSTARVLLKDFLVKTL